MEPDLARHAFGVMVQFLLLLFFIPCMVGMFLIANRLYARFTDWPKLSTRYQVTDMPEGEDHRWVGYLLWRSNERELFHVRICEPGLLLYKPWLMSWGYPPLLIPWSELTFMRPIGLLRRSMAVQIGKPYRAAIALPLSLIPRIKPWLRENDPTPPIVTQSPTNH